MRHVATNADLGAIHRSGDGLIFNDYPSVRSAAQYKVLHLAWCSGVARMLGRVDTSAPSVPKIFFEDIDEADSWLAIHRGPPGTGWKPCDTCLPGHNAGGGIGSTERRVRPELSASGLGVVFTEREVEGFLYAHLRQTGFSVREKVIVPSGIIDAVAERDGARVVIEVKGEDKGGYGTAQMNFQVGIGQVSSRMSDAAAAYAIGFPLTLNFVKVLRTFRGSLVFERLGLVMYAVGRDGSVQEVGPHDARGWIENLPAQMH
jgi:Holliday junction resolvase-like predicted endonuclease